MDKGKSGRQQGGRFKDPAGRLLDRLAHSVLKLVDTHEMNAASDRHAALIARRAGSATSTNTGSVQALLVVSVLLVWVALPGSPALVAGAAAGFAAAAALALTGLRPRLKDLRSATFPEGFHAAGSVLALWAAALVVSGLAGSLLWRPGEQDAPSWRPFLLGAVLTGVAAQVAARATWGAPERASTTLAARLVVRALATLAVLYAVTAPIVAALPGTAGWWIDTTVHWATVLIGVSLSAAVAWAAVKRIGGAPPEASGGDALWHDLAPHTRRLAAHVRDVRPPHPRRRA